MVNILVVFGGLFGILFAVLLAVQEEFQSRNETHFSKRVEALSCFVAGISLFFIFLTALFT